MPVIKVCKKCNCVMVVENIDGKRYLCCPNCHFKLKVGVTM